MTRERKQSAVTRKRPRGRPLSGSEPRGRVNLTLPESVRAKARKIGGDNESRGIEIAVRAYPDEV